MDSDNALTKGRSSGPLFLGLPRATVVRFAVGTLLIVAALVALWQRKAPLQLYDLGGYTMGSTWSARVVAPPGLNVVGLRAGIDAQLGELDRQLSGYRPSAELAQLNAATPGEWRNAPQHLAAVVRFGQHLHDESGGAFDMTVRPLVQLWGFGDGQPRTELPSDQEIEAARARIGNDRIELSPDGARIRRVADVTLDVDAIAPGYAADIIAGWLAQQGLPNHLVEIGGEVRADGLRPDGSTWRLGIERPTLQKGEIDQVIAVTNRGIATSGDYRAFEELGGKRYSHTIDPVTGRPVVHELASVTVVAPSTLEADGYSTTLMVLGPERGMAWADAHGLGVYMILRSAGGVLNERYNAAFAPLLVASTETKR